MRHDDCALFIFTALWKHEMEEPRGSQPASGHDPVLPPLPANAVANSDDKEAPQDTIGDVDKEAPLDHHHATEKGLTARGKHFAKD